ncbi:ZMPSTE24 family protein [Megaselia abdita]
MDFLCIMILLHLAENTLDLWLSRRQVKVYKNSKTVPNELKDVMKVETFEKARLYGLDKEQFGTIKQILLDVIVTTIEMYLGYIGYVWAKSEDVAAYFGYSADHEILVSCIFMFLNSCIGIVKDIPFKVYHTFVLEERHGFNKQTVGFFIKDQIKAFVVMQVLMIPIISAIIYIVQHGGDQFFLWLWLFCGIVGLALMTIYPAVIAPLFDKYRPLEDGPLKKSIEDLAASLSFPLTKLLVVEGSKRSAHSNAYFYGLWKSKRIVLFDTLLLNKGKKEEEVENKEDVGKGCTDEEVLAVLGHELGHWKLGHVTKNIIIMQANLLFNFLMFSYLFKFDAFYLALGLPKGKKPILVGLLVILTYVLAAYNVVVHYLMTVLSRKFEYQADAFAKELGFADKLKDSLIKLNIDNLGFPYYDKFYSAWHHSHPTLLQRLEVLKEDSKKKQ